MIFRRWICCLALAAVAFAAVDRDGDAASRKPRHPPAATTSRDIEPDTTGTIPAKAPARPADDASATSRDDETLPPPFRLPAAPRARMRDCGLKWQAMKMSGEASDDIWRTFATQCLAAATGPFADKPPAQQPPPAASSAELHR